MPANLTSDLLLYGLELIDVPHPFNIGPFSIHPKYNLRRYLTGYPPDRIRQILEREPIFASCSLRDKTGTETEGILWELTTSYFSQVDQLLAAFRLYKSGWIQTDRIIPIIRTPSIKIMKDIDAPPFEQSWADPLIYKLNCDEIPFVQAIYNDLSLAPNNYIDVAIKRFNRSYDYYLKDEIDDCFADLVIALESLTSRGGDSIMQSMVLRITMLLAKKYADRKMLESRVRTYYNHRSQILHGGKIDEKKRDERHDLLEELRGLVRDTVTACIDILKLIDKRKLPRTMAETIDAHIHNYLMNNNT